MTYHLYHYFDSDSGPFKNLSSLTSEKANEISAQLRQEGKSFASQRSDDYMLIRRELERTAREKFIDKRGRPRNIYPHYMTVGPCEWLKSWYTKPNWISINWDEFQEQSISFTYGDLFPTMRYQDKKPYRGQIYTKNEIKSLIKEYGFPQEWNKQGDKGPERYIEVQVWDDQVIKRFFKTHKKD
ncbi:hypothetical protein [Paenibacillus sp. R14(2021)]|uniref:hypothetical protein n=1 Tax=Paenibacillus sp. R14(2021) TaxID=2859228 RepID=UPI001C6153D1|nr:hypothetical protein [Paenibacillus sp. R14(2021)]